MKIPNLFIYKAVLYISIYLFFIFVRKITAKHWGSIYTFNFKQVGAGNFKSNLIATKVSLRMVSKTSSEVDTSETIEFIRRIVGDRIT